MTFQAASLPSFDHRTLVGLVQAGHPLVACARFQPGGWVLEVKSGTLHSVLASSRAGAPRQFKRLESLVCYLLGIGLTMFAVDGTGFDPAAITTTRRPDASDRMRRATAAVRVPPLPIPRI